MGMFDDLAKDASFEASREGAKEDIREALAKHSGEALVEEVLRLCEVAGQAGYEAGVQQGLEWGAAGVLKELGIEAEVLVVDMRGEDLDDNG